jgi:hypothetical protein
MEKDEINMLCFLSFSKNIGFIIKEKQFQMLVLELPCASMHVHIQKYKTLPDPRFTLCKIIFQVISNEGKGANF